MALLFWPGFLFGALSVVALECWVLLLAVHRLRRKGVEPPPPEPAARDLDGEKPFAFNYNKQGFTWVLEPEKVPKLNINEPLGKVSKELSKKRFVEVQPVKKHAQIKDRSLILSDLDGSQLTIELLNCTVVAVSASDLPSRKWAKRYPIRLESKNSGRKPCYLYFDTSWEKESWCKALRLASYPDKERLNWYAQLRKEFHRYLASLGAEYPAFLKPPAQFGEVTDKPSRIDGSSSKVRHFLKKLAKKASKNGVEIKTDLVSSSTHAERKTSDISSSSHDTISTDGSTKGYLEGRSSSSSLLDLVQPTSPTSFSSINKRQVPFFSDPVCSEKLVTDEGALCLNLLFSRLFFDAKRSTELNNAIKARIQRTLSNMRTPTYIGGVTCTGLDLGSLPPYIHKIRVLPVDLNEVWAVEVDMEYSGGIILDIETRIEVCEPELEKDIIGTSFGQTSSGEVTSDLLEGIEYYGNQLKISSNSVDQMENKDAGDTVDALKHTKNTSWKSGSGSRWKAVLQSIADQVSQVPLSLAVKVASLRGTLRLHIKPPPSDQLWFGFTSMPEIDWNLDSSVGDRKITSSHIGLLIGNRFKAAIRETLVLPNCESICIPWMLAEKDDWVPRKVAPFIWINQEPMDMVGLDSSNSQPGEAKMKLDGSSGSKTGPIVNPDDKVEKIKNVIHVQKAPLEAVSESVTSPTRSDPVRSVSINESSNSSTSEELRVPLLRTDETQEGYTQSRMQLPKPSLSEAVASSEVQTIPLDEDLKPRRISSRRARMLDLGKKMGEKLEEKRRHIEEKSRHIVEKMRENTRT